MVHATGGVGGGECPRASGGKGLQNHPLQPLVVLPHCHYTLEPPSSSSAFFLSWRGRRVPPGGASVSQISCARPPWPPEGQKLSLLSPNQQVTVSGLQKAFGGHAQRWREGAMRGRQTWQALVAAGSSSAENLVCFPPTLPPSLVLLNGMIPGTSGEVWPGNAQGRVATLGGAVMSPCQGRLLATNGSVCAASPTIRTP